MPAYDCHICKKIFKTTQHLNQHKNKKKPCTLINQDLNEFVSLPVSKGKSNSFDNLTVIDIMTFVKTSESIQNLINDSKLIQEYKRRIIILTKENESLNTQLKNIQQIIYLTSIKNSQLTVTDTDITNDKFNL
jgi:hypothetical protein